MLPGVLNGTPSKATSRPTAGVRLGGDVAGAGAAFEDIVALEQVRGACGPEAARVAFPRKAEAHVAFGRECQRHLEPGRVKIARQRRGGVGIAQRHEGAAVTARAVELQAHRVPEERLTVRRQQAAAGAEDGAHRTVLLQFHFRRRIARRFVTHPAGLGDHAAVRVRRYEFSAVHDGAIDAVEPAPADPEGRRPGVDANGVRRRVRERRAAERSRARRPP